MLRSKLNILMVMVLLIACKKESITEQRDIKALIVSMPNLPDPPSAHSAVPVNTEPIAVSDGDINYNCSETTYSYANNMDNMIAFNPNAGTLYPGSLVQGKYVRNGELASIGSFPCAPLTLTMDNYGISEEVESPSNASISYAIQKMIVNYTGTTIAKIAYKEAEAYSTDQGLLSLGIDYKWANASLGTSFNVSSSHLIHTIFVYFMQEYYTVSMNQPSNPANLFAQGVDLDALRQKVTSDNPLCYVSSVTYGRMLIAKISSTASIQEMKAAINASIGKLSGSISYTEDEILRNSSYEVYIVGGGASDAMSAATGGLNGIKKYLDNGADFSSSSKGLPISYVVRHASDNSIVKMGKALEYTVRDNCYLGAKDEVQRFSLSIDNFYIGGDCDNGVLTNTGAGEFTYKIEIKDNDQVIKTFANYQEASISNGETLYINSSPFEFNVSKLNNHKITISGCLSEWDSGVSTDLRWQDIDFYYPWSSIKTSDSTFTQSIDQGSDCGAKLNYRIKTIPVVKKK